MWWRSTRWTIICVLVVLLIIGILILVILFSTHVLPVTDGDSSTTTTTAAPWVSFQMTGHHRWRNICTFLLSRKLFMHISYWSLYICNVIVCRFLLEIVCNRENPFCVRLLSEMTEASCRFGFISVIAVWFPFFLLTTPWCHRGPYCHSHIVDIDQKSNNSDNSLSITDWILMCCKFAVKQLSFVCMVRWFVKGGIVDIFLNSCSVEIHSITLRSLVLTYFLHSGGLAWCCEYGTRETVYNMMWWLVSCCWAWALCICQCS